MKKIIAIFLIITLLFSLTSCGLTDAIALKLSKKTEINVTKDIKDYIKIKGCNGSGYYETEFDEFVNPHFVYEQGGVVVRIKTATDHPKSDLEVSLIDNNELINTSRISIYTIDGSNNLNVENGSLQNGNKILLTLSCNRDILQEYAKRKIDLFNEPEVITIKHLPEPTAASNLSQREIKDFIASIQDKYYEEGKYNTFKMVDPVASIAVADKYTVTENPNVLIITYIAEQTSSTTTWHRYEYKVFKDFYKEDGQIVAKEVGRYNIQPWTDKDNWQEERYQTMMDNINECFNGFTLKSTTSVL